MAGRQSYCVLIILKPSMKSGKVGENKPDGIAEKNWGVFRSDRTPKTALEEYYNIDK